MSASATVAPGVAARGNSYGQILKSSVLVGGSSAVNIVVGIARSKAMALLLGPSGVGLAGLFASLSDLAFTVSSLGLNSSSVREIAAAVGSNDADRVARVTLITRRMWVVLGLLAIAAMVLASRPLSRLTFQSARYSGAVCLLSAAVFFRLMSSGQSALLQGMRRIADLARMSALGSVVSSATSVALVWWLGEAGIVPSLALGAAALACISWYFSRQIQVAVPKLSWQETVATTRPLLELGVVFMATSLLTMGSAYLIRILILHTGGVQATGLYQSAWTIGGLYAGFILQAMGTDFYPRLTAHSDDNETCNRLVNEQAQVGFLLGGPGVLATLTFAPLVITILYSSRFAGAAEVLRWIALGTALQIVSWPMGFILLAKGRKAMFLLSDLAWTLVYLGLALILVRRYGAVGAGMAFCGSYLYHIVMTYCLVAHLTRFRVSAQTFRISILLLSAMAVVFAATAFLPGQISLAVGTLVSGIAAWLSLRTLLRLLEPASIPKALRPLAGWAL